MKFSRPVLINGAIVLVILLAVGGGILLLHPFSASGSSSATQLTSTVQTGTVSKTITASGSIAAVRTVAPTFSVSGTVASVDVTLGQEVTAGQQLGTLDTATLQTAVDEASTAYTHAKENLTAAQTQPGAQVSQINAAADAKTKAWDAYLAAKANLAATTLTSPIAGLVVAVNGTVGASAGSSSGGTGATGSSTTGSSTTTSSGFVTIADVSQYIVTASIAEADIARWRTSPTRAWRRS